MMLDFKCPAPGEALLVPWSAVPQNCGLLGLAPIGQRWGGRRVNGQIVPDKGCPPGEFAVTHAIFRGVIHEVVMGEVVVSAMLANPGDATFKEIAVAPYVDHGFSLVDCFDLDMLQGYCRGYVEAHTLPHGRIVVCAEDGDGLEVNMAASTLVGYMLVGPVIILSRRAK